MPEDASAALSAGATPAEAPPRARWPGLSRARHNDTEADLLPAMDAQDSNAWALPYTDLTMLLMVFFIVKLSLVDIHPPHSAPTPNEEVQTASVVPRLSGRSFHAPEQAGTGALTPFDGAPALLDGAGGLLPDAPARPLSDGPVQPGTDNTREAEGQTDAAAPPADPWRDGVPEPDPSTAFSAEWERRVQALSRAAGDFLVATGLEAQVDLVVSDTGIELRLPDKLLFPSGSAGLQTSGADLLTRLSALLQTLEGDIQISGHTDTVPINTARFPSNWELSAARAIEVVRLLRSTGVPEVRMEAVGHGSNRPIASNATAEGRAINRRVTIDVSPRPVPR